MENFKDPFNPLEAEPDDRSFEEMVKAEMGDDYREKLDDGIKAIGRGQIEAINDRRRIEAAVAKAKTDLKNKKG